MTASQIGYIRVLGWVKGYLAGFHKTVVVTVTWIIICILAGQCLRAAALARVIPAEEPGSGRNRLRRVHRWWQGPALSLEKLTPRLIKASLRLLPDLEEVIVAVDTTRLKQRWEVWQAGIVFAGHTLPVAWAVLSYPWPKGEFRKTSLALVDLLAKSFPAGQRWVLVGDRGFPSVALFNRLQQGKLAWTIRLRINEYVRVEGVYAPVHEHLAAGRVQAGQWVEAAIGPEKGREAPVVAGLVVNEEPLALPKHKRNPGTERERAERAQERERHLEHKGRRYAPPSAVAKRYAHTWVLFTTALTVTEAVEQYRMRMAIEETFRDWHHGWGVREAAAEMTKETMVLRLIGIVCLAYRLQVELGWRLSQDAVGQQRRRQWTATDRVSLFWCGQQLFQDRGFDWSGWLGTHWHQLILPENQSCESKAA